MRRAIVVGLIVVSALTGCVGIPTSGGVETGPVIDEQLDPDFVIDPSGPRPGSSPEDILADFMLAVRGPQNNYEIARQFLTADLAQAWAPDASVTIRTGIPSVTIGTAPDTLEYGISSEAYVDADGRYFEPGPATQVLSFAFAKEKGEWRISAAPDGIVLTQSSFNVVFTERPLYFFDPTYTYLVPDVRWFPARTRLPVSIVRELLDGPAAWLQQGVVLSAFPISTSLDTASIQSGVATVALSTEALTANVVDRDRMRQQLSATLDVANVVMTVGGIEITAPASGPQATKDPTVEGATLIATDAAFGFDTGEGVSALDGFSSAVIAANATSATLSNDQQYVVILAPGGAYALQKGSDLGQPVDDRPGLVAPSIDPFQFVWSAQAASAATLSTFAVDGTEHPLASGPPADATVVSIDVSRDGARLLLYLSTSLGPRLAVAGIIRDQKNIPTALGPLEYLAAASTAPIDATWVDNRTVATVSRGSEIAPVTLYEIGGPSAPLGQVPDATVLVGGNGGAEGLRALRSTGDVLRPQGSSWVSTGLSARLLATKQ